MTVISGRRERVGVWGGMGWEGVGVGRQKDNSKSVALSFVSVFLFCSECLF